MALLELDEELLNLLLNRGDLRLELGALIGNHGGRNDRARHPTGPSKSLFGAHKDVRHILVLTEKREMQQNLQGLRVGRHDDELGQATVERLGGLVGPLLQLLVADRLLHQIQDFGG